MMILMTRWSNQWHGCRIKMMKCSIGRKRNALNMIKHIEPYMEVRSKKMSEWMEPLATPVKKKRKKPLKDYERYHQIALVKWLRLIKIDFHSIPNEGSRSVRLGAVMRSMGLTAGASDLFICEPRGEYHGFYIEMKAPRKYPTQSQYDFLFARRKKGYKAEWFDDWEKAKLAVEEYIGLGKK